MNPTQLQELRSLAEDVKRDIESNPGLAPECLQSVGMYRLRANHNTILALVERCERLERGLQTIVRHYENPNHDHNWAYYATDVAREALK